MKNYRGWLFKFAEANGLGKEKTVDGVTYRNCFDFGRRLPNEKLVGFYHAGEFDEESNSHSAEIGIAWSDLSDRQLYAGNERGVAFLRSYWPKATVVCCFKRQATSVEQAVKQQPALKEAK